MNLKNIAAVDAKGGEVAEMAKENTMRSESVSTVGAKVQLSAVVNDDDAESVLVARLRPISLGAVKSLEKIREESKITLEDEEHVAIRFRRTRRKSDVQFSIGRLMCSDIELSHLKYVSGTHCSFSTRWKVGPFCRKDVSPAFQVAMLLQDTSSNGTFVNGYKIGKGKKVILSEGDLIALQPAAAELCKNCKTDPVKYNASLKSQASPIFKFEHACISEEMIPQSIAGKKRKLEECPGTDAKRPRVSDSNGAQKHQKEILDMKLAHAKELKDAMLRIEEMEETIGAYKKASESKAAREAGKVRDKEKENRELQGKIRVLEEQLAKANAEMARKDSELVAASEKAASLENEKNSLTTRLGDANDKVIKATETIEELEERMREKDDEHTESASTNDIKMIGLQATVKTLRSQLAASKSEFSAFKLKADALRIAFDGVRKHIRAFDEIESFDPNSVGGGTQACADDELNEATQSSRSLSIETGAWDTQRFGDAGQLMLGSAVADTQQPVSS